MAKHFDVIECESFTDKSECEQNIDDKIQEDILLCECSPIIIHESVLLVMAYAKWHSLARTEQVYMLTSVKLLRCFVSLRTDHSKSIFLIIFFPCRIASHYPYTLYWLASAAVFYVRFTFNLQGGYCFNRIHFERKIFIFQARQYH